MMKQGWEIKKLGEVCENVSNINWKTISLDTKLPYIDLSAVDIDNSNIDDFEYINKDNAPSRAKQIVNTGDVIFATTRPSLKRVCVITKSFNNAIASTGFCVLRPKGKVVSKWIYYILKSDSFYTYIEPLQKGISYPAVSDNEVKNFSIPVPPLAEQEHIVAELDLLSGIIEKQKQQLKEYDTLAQSIFYTMFGDPITNEKGWEVKTLGEVCTIERGGSPRPIQSYLTDSKDGINWIKIGDATEGSKYITSTKEKIKPEGVKKSRFVHSGDFILSNSMSFGRPYILAIDGCIHDGWLVIHDKENTFDKSYLYYYLGSPSIYNEFKALAVGGVVNNLNSELVRKVKVVIPSLSLQQSFATKIEAIEKQKAILKQSIEEAETLFNSRMDYYFN